MSRSLLLTIGVALALPTLPAQEKDAMLELETEFATKVDSLHKPVTERYITALEALKKTYEDRGELPSASAVTKELELAKKGLASGSRTLFPSRLAQPKTTGLFTVENTPVAGSDEESDSIPRAAPGDINLMPASAAFSGGTSLLSPQEVVQGFSKPGATVSWTISEISPGTYDIILDYSSGAKGGGGSLQISALSAEADVVIEPAGSWKNFRRKRVGGIKVTTPPVTVKIETNSAKSAVGAMALRRVILRPRSGT